MRGKRFYKTASAVSRPEGHTIVLDGRPIRSPAKASLLLPTAALAEAVAAEWRAQGDRVDPTTMPLTRLVNTVIDGVRRRREEVVRAVAAYGTSDLLCYRAEAPVALVERQARVWQPLVDWAERRFDVALAVTAGIVHVAQPPATLAKLSAAVEAYDDFGLGALQLATGAAGSLIIGLALLEGEIDPQAAFHASQLDETFQIEHWGEDETAAKRRAELFEELECARRLYVLSRA